MPLHTSIDTQLKPRVLIADDSRIVRATLIKHIEGMFEFREALDGEQAWQTLLIDPSIRVVISDLSMPNLDGYGLLQRIRASKISRIRTLPVVVVSGSDEQEERERAKAAGATDLITKGIGAAQLLSRLDVLSKLVSTQHEFERGLEALVRNPENGASIELPSPEAWTTQAETMRADAVRQGRNFVMLNACVGLKHTGLDSYTASPPISIVNAIGQLLRRTVRQTDCVAKTGEAEFTVATGSIHFDSARNFAQRICRAIAGANLIKDDRMSFIASCGLVSLSEYGADKMSSSPPLPELRDIAKRRASLGLHHALSGVVGAEEELLLMSGRALPDARASELSIRGKQKTANDNDAVAPSLATLLQWIKDGKQDRVLEHLANLSSELQPLVDLMLHRQKRL